MENTKQLTSNHLESNVLGLMKYDFPAFTEFYKDDTSVKQCFLDGEPPLYLKEKKDIHGNQQNKTVAEAGVLKSPFLYPKYNPISITHYAIMEQHVSVTQHQMFI